LTQGKEYHEVITHYIVTNTHPLGYSSRYETFQNMLFSLVQHLVSGGQLLKGRLL